MPSPEERFLRLARLARRDPQPETPPELSGALATRVLARLRSEREDVTGIWERLSLRAVPIAAALALACFFLLHVPPAASDERRLAQSVVEAQLTP